MFLTHGPDTARQQSASQPPSLRGLIENVRSLQRDLDAATGGFAAAAGLACVAGCGRCCLKSSVEAAPVELLPLAETLARTGESEAAHAAALAAPAGPCVNFQAHPTATGMGRCARYADRPGVCRLFGFATVRTRSGPELAVCGTLKDSAPAAVARAADMADRAPVLSDLGLRVAALTPDPALHRFMPINRALAAAIEHHWLRSGGAGAQPPKP